MIQSRLTRRGKAVLVVVALLAAFAFGHATRDICWVGTSFPDNTLGYGSCQAMINYVQEGNK